MGKQGVKIEIMDTTLRDGEQTTMPTSRLALNSSSQLVSL